MGEGAHSQVVSRPRVCFIGAGNVATHMAQALDASCADVVQVISRHAASANALAGKMRSAVGSDSLHTLIPDADFYIISASDDAIPDIVKQTPDHKGIWAHTSGSVGIDVFEGSKTNFGVFYPLQTFSRDLDVDFSKVPMFVEGNSTPSLGAILGLARKISGDVEVADSDFRRRLHVAAVFANNFTNHLWDHADRLLRRDGLDIRKLLPLLEMTLQKVNNMSPHDAQTGPARRGDTSTIEKHLAMLPDEQRSLYRLLSQSIFNTYNTQNEQNKL